MCGAPVCYLLLVIMRDVGVVRGMQVVVTSEGFKAFPQFKDIPADAIAMRDGRLKQILAQDLVSSMSVCRLPPAEGFSPTKWTDVPIFGLVSDSSRFSAVLKFSRGCAEPCKQSLTARLVTFRCQRTIEHQHTKFWMHPLHIQAHPILNPYFITTYL